MLATLAATIALAAVVSLGRARIGWQYGFSSRYVSLTAPLLACAHLAWTAYGGRISGRLVPAVLAVVAGALLPLNLRAGDTYARDLRRAAEELEALVHGGARTSEILAHYSDRFYVAPALARPLLAWLALEHRPPFDKEPGIPASSFEYPMFDREPVAMESPSPTSQRFFDRELDPAARESDRGVQSLELELPPHAAGEIVLVTDITANGQADRTWLYWREITIR
jgi:hypothetical protein